MHETSPTLEFATEIAVTIAAPLVIGEIGGGVREVIPITGGTMHGPLLNGEVLPGGADWCLTRPDGTSEVWARYTLRTDDGTLISIINAGTCRANAHGDFEGQTVPQFEVADGPYAFLRETRFVGKLLTNSGGTLARVTLYRVLPL